MNNKEKSKQYKVAITETSSRIVTISVDEVQRILNIKSAHYPPTPANICSAVHEKWNHEEIVLGPEDFDCVDFDIYDENGGADNVRICKK